MKKIYSVLVVSIALLSFQSHAQISVGLGGGILKSTEDNAEALFGGELYAKYDLSENMRAGVSLGYYQDSEDFLTTKIVSSLVPVSLLGEYRFLEEKFRPYAGLHVGIFHAGVKIGSTKTTETYFSASPVVGIDYRLMGNFNLNLNFKYGFSFYKNEITDEIENFSSISPNIGIFYTL